MGKIILVSGYNIKGRPEKVLFDSLKKSFKQEKFKTVCIQYKGSASKNSAYSNIKMEKYYAYITSKILKVIANKDIIFFVDGLTPVVSTIAHYIASEKLSCKLVGYWHQIPTRKDNYLYGSEFGNSWVKHISDCLDTIFVGSKFMQEELEELHIPSITAYLPLPDYLPKPSKKEDVIGFFHRISVEKPITNFIKYCENNCKKGIIITTSEKHLAVNSSCVSVYYTSSKNKALKKLATCKYSWSLFDVEESFGYATLEAYLLKCIPILNSNGSYSELYPDIKSTEEWKPQPVIDLCANCCNIISTTIERML